MESRILNRLKAKIDAAIVQNMETMAGGAAADYPTHRQAVGYISGLRDALILAEETDKDLAEGI